MTINQHIVHTSIRLNYFFLSNLNVLFTLSMCPSMCILTVLHCNILCTFWSMMLCRHTTDSVVRVSADYSQFAPKPARPPYQLAPLPARPNQLAPLILPTRPTSTNNSCCLSTRARPVLCQLAPTLQLAPLLLPARPTSLTNSPHVFANFPHFFNQVGCVYDCSCHTNQSK